MTKIYEVWKPILSLNKLYEASNLGRIRSEDKIISIKGRKPFIKKGKILKQTIGNHGYPVINLGSYGYHLVHRIVAETFCNKDNGKDHVDHINSVRSDNRSINLQWVTQLENNKKQKIAKGSEKKISKLVESDINKIREEFVELSKVINANNAYLAIGKKYGVSRCTIYDVIKNKTWKHVGI